MHRNDMFTVTADNTRYEVVQEKVAACFIFFWMGGGRACSSFNQILSKPFSASRAHTSHNPTLLTIVDYRVINAAPSMARGWILIRRGFLFTRGSLEACGEGGLTTIWRAAMLRLLINPFSITVWDLATCLYGNSPVQGWRERWMEGGRVAAIRGERKSGESWNQRKYGFILISNNYCIQALWCRFLGFNFKFT